MFRDKSPTKIVAKTIILSTVLAITIPICLTACSVLGDKKTTTITANVATPPPIQVSFIANFYDNYGTPWLSAEGSNFDISPNKIKEYSYDSDGDWISSYTTSSVVSITIDGKHIESCGSTVTFADSRLKQYPVNIPEEINTITNSNEASISSPKDIRAKDYWTLNWWWIVKDAYDYSGGAKIVVIQSQQGDPICMYAGDDVIWEVSKNLPKTTEITIDGMKLYIHRANFAILDTTLFK